MYFELTALSKLKLHDLEQKEYKLNSLNQNSKKEINKRYQILLLQTCTTYVSSIGRRELHIGFWLEHPKERDYFEDTVVEGTKYPIKLKQF